MAVFLTGTVKCSRNETFDVAVDLKQDTKKKSVTATGTVAVACKTTAQPWSVALAPDSGAFAVGSGVASAKSANTAGWVTPASTSLPVRIFMGHR
jgi:hypothetical protein